MSLNPTTVLVAKRGASVHHLKSRMVFASLTTRRTTTINGTRPKGASTLRHLIAEPNRNHGTVSRAFIFIASRARSDICHRRVYSKTYKVPRRRKFPYCNTHNPAGTDSKFSIRVGSSVSNSRPLSMSLPLLMSMNLQLILLRDSELKIVGEYGLRNKREVWRVLLTLSKIRRAARYGFLLLFGLRGTAADRY